MNTFEGLRRSARWVQAWRFQLCAPILAMSAATGFGAVESTVKADPDSHITMDGGVTRTPLAVTYTTDPNGVKHVKAQGSLGGYNALTEDHVVAIYGEASSGPGSIRAFAHGFAINFSHVPNVPPLSYALGARGSFGGTFSDSILVTNSNPALKVGDAVRFRVTVRSRGGSWGTYRVGGQWDTTGYFPGSYALSAYVGLNAGVNYYFPNGLYQQVPDNLNFDIPIEVDASIGDSVPIYLSFGVGVEERAGQWPNGTHYANVQESIVDASHTVIMNIDPITPGIAFQSESGHYYGTPISTILKLNQLTKVGPNIYLTGSGGPTNAAFQILTSTNAALPLNEWTVQGTGAFDSTGQFTFAAPNAFHATNSPRFYVVREVK